MRKINFRRVFVQVSVIIVLLIPAFAKAQLYPVQITSQLIPPYSVYLSDYATPGNEKLRVILVQRDLTLPAYQLRLVMNVELDGKTILRTARTYNPPPISLNPGVPTVISGAELSPYLDSRNIDFIGYSREQYERTRALPEGSYQITFTAYDYHRQDVQVSNEGFSFYYLSKNEPPLINFPACGTQIPMRTPQQIIFSWLPRNTTSPNSAAETQYEFALYETRPATRNPNDVVLSTQPVYRTLVDYPQLIYGPAEPLLLDNMKYVWRVRAIDKEGRDAFRNNGYSEICTFTYGGNVDPNFSIGVVTGVEAQGETERRAVVKWHRDDFDAYRVNYKKSGSGYEWFTSDVTEDQLKQDGKTNGELKLFDLEPNTEYETRIQGKKSGIYGGYSDIIKFKTMPLRVPQCGDQTPLPGDTQKNPFRSGIKGTVVNADGMEITFTEVTNLGEGFYKGFGRVSINYLGGAAFNVQFDKIFVDEDRNVGQGRIDFITQGVAAMMEQQLAGQQKRQDEKKQQENRDQWTGTDFYDKVFVYDQIEIESVTSAGASMVNVTDKEGNTTANAEVMQVINSAPDKAVIIQDKNGDQFVVQKDKTTGEVKVTKVEGGGLLIGNDGKMMSEQEIRDLKKLILATLNKFKSAIDDYQASLGTDKGGKRSVLEMKVAMLLAKLPSCLEDHKDNLDPISRKIEILTPESKEFDEFTTLIGSMISEEERTNIEKVEPAVCEALVEGLRIDIVEERTYITPAGTLIKLPAGHKVNTICIDQSLYPNGALLSFTINGKTYSANIPRSGTLYFKGYFEVDGDTYGNPYIDPNIYIAQKTDAYFVELTTDVDGQSTGGKIYVGEFVVSDNRGNQEIVKDGYVRVNFFTLPAQKINTNSINLLPTSCPKLSYIVKLKQQLASALKNYSNTAYIVEDCATGNRETVTADGKNDTKNKNVITLAFCNGKISVKDFKYSSLQVNSKLAGLSKAEMESALKDKLNEELNAAQNAAGGQAKADGTMSGLGLAAQTLENGERLKIDKSNLWAFLPEVVDLGKSIYENATLPEKYWNPAESGYEESLINLAGMPAGVTDGIVDQVTEKLQFVKLGLDIATEPEIITNVWNKVKGLNYEDIKNGIANMAQSKAEKYTHGGPVAYHEGGKDVVIVGAALWGLGAVIIDKITKQSDEVAEELGEEIAKGAGKTLDDLPEIIKSIVAKFPDETTKKKFLNDYFDNASDAFKKSVDANPKLVDAWKRLDDAEVDVSFRKNPDVLEKINELYDPEKFQLPGNRPIVDGKKLDGNFTVKTRDGLNDVYFDKNGFPDFDKYSLGNNFSYKPDGKVLNGTSSDLTSATNWLKAKYAGDPNIKVISNGSNIDVVINGTKNTYTWHHYQDGKTLIPVLTSVHSNVAHTGGAAIIQKGLEGIFPSPF